MSSAICLVWAQARDTPPHDRRGPPFHPQQPLAFHRLARAPPRAKSPAVARLRRARDGGREEHSPLACRGLVFPSYSCGGCEPGFRKVAASPPGCAPRPGPSPDVLRACVRCLGCGCASGGLGAAEEVPWGRGGLPALTGQNLLRKEAGATEDSTRQTGERCSGQDGAGPPPAVWDAVGPFKGALFLGVHLYPPPPSLSCPSRNLSRPHLASPPPSRGRGRALCVQGPGLWRRLFPLRGSSVSPRGDAFN